MLRVRQGQRGGVPDPTICSQRGGVPDPTICSQGGGKSAEGTEDSRCLMRIKGEGRHGMHDEDQARQMSKKNGRMFWHLPPFR